MPVLDIITTHPVREMPPDIVNTVEEWVGKKIHIVHWWESEGTYFILAGSHSPREISCLRVFPIGDHLELSEDNNIFFKKGTR